MGRINFYIMRYKCKYNPDKDIARVVPNLSISLKNAVETGSIKDTGYIPEFNNIDDPSKVVGIVRDNFEAVDAMEYIRATGQKSQTPTQVQTLSTPSEGASE